MLIIAAVSCQWLNADVICQGEKVGFSKSRWENVGFHKKSSKIYAIELNSGKFLSKMPYKSCRGIRYATFVGGGTLLPQGCRGS